jgi:hypothetical protein
MKHHRPEDLFRAEKERARSSTTSQHARLLAEAKAAFDKLMAEGQAARKSGRPRKHPLPPLKTTSSRVPPKPPTPPPVVAKAPTPAPTPAPIAVKPAVKPAAKPVKAAVKAAAPSKPAAKKKATAPAKSKTKSAKKR